MSYSDPIADMLTRIRNAITANHPQVMVRRSKVCLGIAQVLKEEGYISDFDSVDDGRQGLIRVTLKYGRHGEKLIQKITRESKPGRRIYRGVEKLPRPLGGMGIAIVSTSSGILSDRDCRKQGVGGELLCTVS